MDKKQNQVILRSNSDRAFDIAMVVICGLIFISVLYPLYFVVLASFSDPLQVAGGKIWLWTTEPTLEGYKKVFDYSKLWVGYKNTIIYAVIGVIAHLLVTIPAAYTLSRRDAMLRGPIMMLFTITMFFSGGIVPTYLVYKSFNLLDTIWVMTLPGCIGVYNLIIARTFFQNNIPGELLDAARIDGCDDFRFFVQIVVPLSSAIIAVVMLYQVVGIWNSYMDGLLYLNSESRVPLQLVLREILVKNSVDGGQMGMGEDELENLKEQMKYCVIVVSTLPMMILYPFVQKFFTKGVMIGSIKG